MDAIILAGGFAKRMWPLTKNKPKQLLNLAGKPMLDYVFDSLDNLCLLYTSPSPRDRQKSRMPSSA